MNIELQLQQQMKMMFKLLLVLFLFIQNIVTYQLNNYYYGTNDADTASLSSGTGGITTEKKYVNSGQSIILVCDLPTNMPDGPVLFIKSDSKVISIGTEIREDGDEQRFEVNQQYAWEWSLKINSISEDDTGVYYCKAGNKVIKQYNIIVRVPPRIRDDSNNEQFDATRIYKEGDSIKLPCFATGTPKPNITWFSIDEETQTLVNLNTNENFLMIKNLTRNTPRYYQCRASNGIPPNDNRNFTYRLRFAPEIEIESKFNRDYNEMSLNCTINAYPLLNKYFWRKNGNYINENMKYKIENIIVSDFKIISKLTIKYYDLLDDQGLYECTAENDLRVTKLVYNLKDNQDLINDNSNRKKKPVNNEIAITSIKNIEQRNQKPKQQISALKKQENINNNDYDQQPQHLLIHDNYDYLIENKQQPKPYDESATESPTKINKKIKSKFNNNNKKITLQKQQPQQQQSTESSSNNKLTVYSYDDDYGGFNQNEYSNTILSALSPNNQTTNFKKYLLINNSNRKLPKTMMIAVACSLTTIIIYYSS